MILYQILITLHNIDFLLSVKFIGLMHFYLLIAKMLPEVFHHASIFFLNAPVMTGNTKICYSPQSCGLESW
jgi:hypothetical protein